MKFFFIYKLNCQTKKTNNTQHIENDIVVTYAVSYFRN